LPRKTSVCAACWSQLTSNPAFRDVAAALEADGRQADELARLNQQIVELAKPNKYAETIPLAQRALELDAANALRPLGDEAADRDPATERLEARGKAIDAKATRWMRFSTRFSTAMLCCVKSAPELNNGKTCSAGRQPRCHALG
jgi:hypothetical protein